MNARNRKLALILAVAAPILIWRLVALSKYFPASAAAQVTAPEMSPAPVEAPIRASHESDLASRLEEARRQLEGQSWGRDPFSAPATAAVPVETAAEAQGVVDETAPPAPKIRFTGVSRAGDRWMAMVQGQFVRVGDRIDGEFLVTEIAKGSLVLEHRGWQFRYDIGSEDAAVSRVRSKQ